MNNRFTQWLPFGSRRQAWYERYFTENAGLIGTALCGIGLGAGLMYILDPDRGGGRRAFVRDKVTGAVNQTGKALGKKSRDLKNRARGIAAETGSLLRRDEVVTGSELRH